jgi:glucose/mannose-6-phosphate isomerase
MISAEIMGQWQQLDASHMLQNILQAPQRGRLHFEKGLVSAYEPPDEKSPHQILVCGMGGSGSTGDFFQALCSASEVPILVHKTPDLPAWVNAETLVICVSYSGNTAETLGCLMQAQQKGAALHLLTSGGTMLEMAMAQDISHVELDGGLPPRAALFDMLFALLGSLSHLSYLHLDTEHFRRVLEYTEKLARDWKLDPAQQVPFPFELAQQLHEKTIHIWGRSGGADTLAVRWKNQLAENAKTLSFAAVLPELNHNEIVPLCHQNAAQRSVIYLGLTPDISAFDAISLELVAEHVSSTHQVLAEGRSGAERLFYLLYLADFVSVYMAYLEGVDPTPIAAIDTLKQRMEKVQA